MYLQKKFSLIPILIIFCIISFILSVSIAGNIFAKSERFPFFTDVPTTHKNFSAITRLETLGTIGGYRDGSFHPDQAVSRGEALKILLLGSKIPVQNSVSTNPFPDVNITEWYAPYVAKAKQKYIVKGREGGKFFPEDTLNTAEALKMIFLVNNISLSSEGEEKIFSDVSREQWFAKYFAEAKKRNFFTQKSTEKIFPAKPLTRGELVQFMYAFQKSEETKFVYSRPSFAIETKKFSTLPRDAWDGITLEEKIFPLVRTHQVLQITGESTSSEVTGVIKFLESGIQEKNTVQVNNGKFSLPLYISQKGKFTIGVFQGRSGNFIAYEGTASDGGENFSNDTQAKTPQNIRASFRNNSLFLEWEKNGNTVFLLEFYQHGKYQKIFSQGSSVEIPSKIFSDFQKGNIFITLKGAKSLDGTSINLENKWSEFTHTVIPIYKGFPSIKRNISVENFSWEYTNKISLGALVEKKADGEINKNIKAYVADGNENLYEKKVEQSQEKISFSFSPKVQDLYLIELVDDQGLTLAVLPSTPKGFFPIIPLLSAQEVRNSDSISDSITRINILRSDHGRQKLVVDAAITELAQIRADDMVSRNYFSHTTPKGKTVNDFRIDLGVKVPLSENIGTSSLGGLDATKNLEFSLTHRANTLSHNHTRLGVGIAKNTKGESIVVQLFASNAPSEGNIQTQREALQNTIEKKFSHLQNQDILNQASEDWANTMAEKKEAQLEFSTGESWKKVLDSYKIQRDIAIYVEGYSSLDMVEKFLDEKKNLGDEKKFYGIDIAVSEEGIIFVVVLVSK